MMTDSQEPITTSPALVELACRIRSDFNRLNKIGVSKFSQKIILKAEDVAKTYYNHNEPIVASELELLYDVLREFGIMASHIPPNFHVDASNVLKFLEKSDKTLTKSHVIGLIFTRM